MTNTTTLATFAATTRATRFWTGTNAAGHVAQFWNAEPRAEDHPGLTIAGHVIMPLIGSGAIAGAEPIGAAPVTAAAPAELTDAQREQVRDAVAQALTGIYYCGRVWSAWQVGTMGEDDFTPAAEIDDVLTEITDAAINAMPPATPSAAPAPESQLGAFEGLNDFQINALWQAAQDQAVHGMPAPIHLYHAVVAELLKSSAPAAPVPAASEGWISVGERLPGKQGEDSEEVLCFLSGHCALTDYECRAGAGWGIRLGYYDADIGMFRTHGRPDDSVTHWMPLPAAPSTDQQEG